jgi:DNA topoisomerase VI B subunit
LRHELHSNDDNQVGTIFQIFISGNWTTYRSRIVQYFQHLAIITPYAELSLRYSSKSAPHKDFYVRYDRRSEQMPAVPATVKHHPSSVNNIIVQHLVQQTRCKTLVRFLSTELQAVSVAVAKRLIAELQSSVDSELDENMSPAELTDEHITRLVQLFRKTDGDKKLSFRPPDGSCLSPLGEYNLNLGIAKVLEPDLIATARDKPGSHEGHSFVVEAAVSLGGKLAKEGVTVYRFANRIPLLLEGGADVSTRVALTKIRWSQYKIDHKRDKVGVFVSIVSTKIPFKGTSKEYIGDDGTYGT